MADSTSGLCGAAGTTLAGPGRFQEIPLAAVDLTDHTFVVPPADDFKPLIASIQEVGLLAPPWLRLRADGQWQVVAGLKRLLAAAGLGWERLPARTFPAAAPEAHCLLVALYDNAFTRGFNLREQAALASGSGLIGTLPPWRLGTCLTWACRLPRSCWSGCWPWHR